MRKSRNTLAMALMALADSVKQAPSLESEEDLSPEALDEVARKAAASLPNEDGAQSTETDSGELGDDAPADTEQPATDDAPATSDTPAEGDDLDTGSLDGADTALDNTGEATPEATEAAPDADPDAEQIETPTEQALDDMSQSGDAEAAEVAKDAEAVAGDDLADPIPGDTAADASPAVDTAAQSEVNAEPPVNAEATPAPPAPAQKEESDEPQQKAEAPSAQDSESATQVAALLEAVAGARNADEVVAQAREASDGLVEVGQVATTLNESGGVGIEGASMFALALAPYERMLGRTLTRNVSLESHLKGKRVLSLESIADAVRELEGNLPVLERQAVESLDRIRDAVLDSLPQVRARLMDVVSQASLASSAGGHQLTLDTGLATTLTCVTDAGPVSLDSVGDCLVGYADLGQRILGRYSQAAYRTAREASMLNNQIDFSSVSAFWDRIDAATRNIRDPRSELTAEQLSTSLPGGARLFRTDTSMGFRDGDGALERILRFVSENAPLEIAAGTVTVDSASTKALSSTMISHIGQMLLQVADERKIKCVFEEGAKLWPEAQDAIRFLRETFRDAPDDIVFDPNCHHQQVIKYVETAYSLATWPIMQYLANLVVTANAFVSLAIESLKPVEVPPADPGSIPQDAVVDAPPPVEEPVVEEDPTDLGEPTPVEDSAGNDDDLSMGGDDLESDVPSETDPDQLEEGDEVPDLDDLEGDASDVDEAAAEEDDLEEEAEEELTL